MNHTQKHCMYKAPASLPESVATVTDAKLINVGQRKEERQKLFKFYAEARDAKNSLLLIIVGEWGAGKSQFINSFINDLDHDIFSLPLRVRASTILNIYEDKEEWIRKEDREELRCLAALLIAAIQHNLHKINLPEQELRRIYDMKPGSSLIFMLESIINKTNKKKIFILIDEFEEVLSRKEDIRMKLISGLKGILDKEVKLISEGGDFEGSLHIIIACTQYAWIEFRRRPEIREFFGALPSRGGPNIIYLERLRPLEVFDLLGKQMESDYGSSEIICPIKPGVVYSIQKASLGNPRAVIQLYIALFRKAKESCPDGYMTEIDGELAVDVFRKTTLNIENEDISCLKDSILSELEEEVKKVPGGIRVLRTLIGELKPFSAYELALTLGYQESEISRILNQLKGFTSITLGGCIVEGYKRLKGGKLDLRRILIDSGIMEESDKLVYREEELEFKDLVDALVYYEFQGLHIVEGGVFIPDRYQELATLLNISDELASEIRSVFKESYLEPTRYYKLSARAINILYPTAAIEELRYITNPRLRRLLINDIVRIWGGRGESLLLESIKHMLRIRGLLYT